MPESGGRDHESARIMNINERRLNGRDVLAKTFPAKTKKGYDPIDVDAYLELVASQVDLLHGDIARAGEASAGGAADGAVVIPAPVATDAGTDGALQTELDAARAERDALQVRLDEELAAAEALKAENQQLRTQLTSVAPPPPTPSAQQDEAGAGALEVAQPEDVTAVVATASTELAVDERASQESYDLVLRAAQRSAEEAISEAHVRADEIVADANLTASRIAQESDRKAYESANRAQGQLAVITTEIETQQVQLAEVTNLADERRSELRRLGETIVDLANQSAAAGVVDLRGATAEGAAEVATSNDAQS